MKWLIIFEKMKVQKWTKWLDKFKNHPSCKFYSSQNISINKYYSLLDTDSFFFYMFTSLLKMKIESIQFSFWKCIHPRTAHQIHPVIAMIQIIMAYFQTSTLWWWAVELSLINLRWQFFQRTLAFQKQILILIFPSLRRKKPSVHCSQTHNAQYWCIGWRIIRAIHIQHPPKSRIWWTKPDSIEIRSMFGSQTTEFATVCHAHLTIMAKILTSIHIHIALHINNCLLLIKFVVFCYLIVFQIQYLLFKNLWTIVFYGIQIYSILRPSSIPGRFIYVIYFKRSIFIILYNTEL